MKRLLLIAVIMGIANLCMAGGPQMAGGPGYGTAGKPLTWAPKTTIHYRVDSGAMATSGTTPIVTNAQGLQRVTEMLQAWHDAPHTSLTFQYDGAITGVAGGHASSEATFGTVMDSCSAGTQSPVMFDPSGSLTADLGLDDAVIGFAGPCGADRTTGYFKGAFLMMNGAWQDHLLSNGELTADEFDEAIIHELGHFLGLDHSQININVFNETAGNCKADTLAGLPLMFPFAYCQSRKSAGLGILAPDDIAWISALYPSDAATAFGKISGQVQFSDGISGFQGANVIARQVDNPSTPADESRRVAVSAVSGYLFTANPGQTVTATYLPCQASSTTCKGYHGDNSNGSAFDSREHALIGYYEVWLPPGDYIIEVEPIYYAFVEGSSVGPLQYTQASVPIPEFWNSDESYFDLPTKKTVIHVGAGQSVDNIDIILNNTAPRFDTFEGPSSRLLPEPALQADAAEVLA